MARGITISLLLIAAIALASLGYHRWSENRAMTTGDVLRDAADSAATPAPPPQSPSSPPQPIHYPPPKSAAAASSSRLQSSSQDQSHARNQAAAPHSIPLTDSIAPNPPNGTVFAGTGRFQVYRQGNLTWRLDTDTGQTCVLFATNAEWRKPRVYRHGCNSTAHP